MTALQQSSKNISVIYTTSPPHSVHLIGYLLKKLSEKVWVADFRDPWTNWVPYLYAPPTETRRKIQEHLEHAVLNFADKVITNTEPMKADFIAKYPDIHQDKYITILNGYDSANFTNARINRYYKFTISYTGRLHFNQNSAQDPRYNPSNFLQAVKVLLDEYPQLRNYIQILLIGTCANRDSALRYIEKLHLGKVVKVIGPVSHKKSIQYLMSSHILLLIHYSGKGSEAWIPAKTFEYIGSGKPILALAPKVGATAELLKSLDCGIIIPPEDLEAIKEALLEMYQRHETGCLRGTTASLAESFDRRRLTKYLAEILIYVLVVSQRNKLRLQLSE